jgi:hypothetical protein
MKKVFVMIVLAGFFLMSCGNNTKTKEGSNSDSLNSEKHVEQNSRDEITPQAKVNPDTPTRLEVDTVSSAESAEKKRD